MRTGGNGMEKSGVQHEQEKLRLSEDAKILETLNPAYIVRNMELTIKILATLIKVYDASDELLEVCQRITGYSLDSNSIAARVLCVSDAIKWFSPMYDSKVDWEDSPVSMILERKDWSEKERAVKLLKNI